jgi:hypothetical protein
MPPLCAALTTERTDGVIDELAEPGIGRLVHLIGMRFLEHALRCRLHRLSRKFSNLGWIAGKTQGIDTGLSCVSQYGLMHCERLPELLAFVIYVILLTCMERFWVPLRHN